MWVIAIVLLIGGVAIFRNTKSNAIKDWTTSPPVQMKLEDDEGQNIYYSFAEDANSKAHGTAYEDPIPVGGREKFPSGSEILKALEVEKDGDKAKYMKEHIVGADLNCSEPALIEMYGPWAQHSSPLSLILITNSILHSILAKSTMTLAVASNPLPFPPPWREQGQSNTKTWTTKEEFSYNFVLFAMPFAALVLYKLYKMSRDFVGFFILRISRPIGRNRRDPD